jgi:uncharacterized membrane protein
MSKVTMWRSDVYHQLAMHHLYVKVSMKFLASEVCILFLISLQTSFTARSPLLYKVHITTVKHCTVNSCMLPIIKLLGNSKCLSMLLLLSAF